MLLWKLKIYVETGNDLKKYFCFEQIVFYTFTLTQNLPLKEM
jgi:hypothetical protein